MNLLLWILAFALAAVFIGAGIAKLVGTRDQQINRTPYVLDETNYGVADHWANQAEFAARGGDCEAGAEACTLTAGATCQDGSWARDTGGL